MTTRIAGVDGVSLEVDHWREILESLGHKVVLVAGQLDRSGVLIPELHFQSPRVSKIYDWVVNSKRSFEDVEVKVFEMAGKIEGLLRQNLGNGSFPDLIIAPNIFSLPMHFSLSVGLLRFIEEFKIPTIARHHDFWWERERFINSSCFTFFQRWFPPSSDFIYHITINSIAHDELFKRANIKSDIIWDCFNFDSGLNQKDRYSRSWREDFGLSSEDIVFLVPTRIVPRKRIELALKLVRKINDPRIILILAGHAGDEGYLYLRKIKKLARSLGVRHKFIGRYVKSRRRIVEVKNNGKFLRKRIYTLWDCYLNSDFVVYPTEKEGFGNQFVESVYFKKPIILTPYSVYNKDIKPLGFESIEVSDKVSDFDVRKVLTAISDKKRIEGMVKRNFDLGKKYLSYDYVKERLMDILKRIYLF